MIFPSTSRFGGPCRAKAPPSDLPDAREEVRLERVRLGRIVLFPIKSFDGVEVPEAEVTAMGSLRHDREWAVVDESGRFVNAKQESRLQVIRAEFAPRFTHVTLSRPEVPPSRFALDQTEALAAWLSAFLGYRVRLIRDGEQGFPDDLEASGPTIVSEASLMEVSDWMGLELDEARRRFRTNLEITNAPVFWEDRLFSTEGRTVEFLIGTLRLLGVNPCQRCAVPTRESRTGVKDPGFQQRFMMQRQRLLPAWAETSRFDHFYRFAVNTRIASGQLGTRIQVGSPIVLPSLKP